VNAALITGQSGRSGDELATVDSLVVSGLPELAIGALTGRPMVLAVSRPEISKAQHPLQCTVPAKWQPDHAPKPNRRRAGRRPGPPAALRSAAAGFG
jgi:hypothetical protein